MLSIKYCRKENDPMRYQKALLFCLILCLQNGFVVGQFRKYSNEFLNIGAGARGLAMGGSLVASTYDGTSGYWNPAGLARIRDNASLSIMHADYFAGIGKYDFVSLALPLKEQNRTLGITVLRFGVDDIPNTLFLVEPDGSINYNNIRTFSSADYAFLLSYGQKLIDEEDRELNFGGSVKVINRKVGTFATAWGFGLDAGLQYRNRNWNFGLSVRDLSTTFNAWSFSFTDREKEMLYLTQNDIPLKSTERTAPRLILGAGYNITITPKISLMMEANMDVTFDGKRNVLIKTDPISVDPRLGMELTYNKQIFIRGGIYNFQRALADGDPTNFDEVWIYQPSVGVGFNLKNIGIDYAFTNLANQSNPLYSHIFSLRLNLLGRNRGN